MRSIIRLANGIYKVGVPWKDGDPNFAHNVAYLRLQKLESSLQTKPEVQKCYHEIIMEYNKKGYIKGVPKETETGGSYHTSR